MSLTPEQENELFKLNSIFNKIEAIQTNSDPEELLARFSLNYIAMRDSETEKLEKLSENRRKLLGQTSGSGAIEVLNQEGEILLKSSFPNSDQ
jgi:hypothetical protein